MTIRTAVRRRHARPRRVLAGAAGADEKKMQQHDTAQATVAARPAGNLCAGHAAADLSGLTANERQHARPVRRRQRRSWTSSSGARPTAIATRCSRASRRTPKLQPFANINYGPWDRLDDNASVRRRASARSRAGAQFYPADMTKEEFEAAQPRRTRAASTRCCAATRTGALQVVPYHVAYADGVTRAAALLDEARGTRRGPRPRRRTSSCAPPRCAPTITSRATSPGST